MLSFFLSLTHTLSLSLTLSSPQIIFQLLHFVKFQRAVLLLPTIQRRLTDVHCAADRFRGLPVVYPAQDSDDLLRRVFLSFWHSWVSFLEPRLSPAMAQFPCVRSREPRDPLQLQKKVNLLNHYSRHAFSWKAPTATAVRLRRFMGFHGSVLSLRGRGSPWTLAEK